MPQTTASAGDFQRVLGATLDPVAVLDASILKHCSICWPNLAENWKGTHRQVVSRVITDAARDGHIHDTVLEASL
jgi:hypothetical protein